VKRKRGKAKFVPPRPKERRVPRPQDPQAPTNLVDGIEGARLTRLAEDIWRLGKRANRETAAEWLAPFLERLDDDLRELGVEVIDRTGTSYKDGETIEVLHSDVPPGWTGARIVTEVIAPTIRIEGHVRGKGKVVLGPAKID